MKFRSPRKIQQGIHLEANQGEEVIILEQQPVLVLIGRFIATEKQILLFLQLDFIRLLGTISTRVATNLDGHAADVFLIIATVIQNAIDFTYVLIDNHPARNFSGVGDGLAHASSRGRHIITGGFLAIDRLDIQDWQPLGNDVA